VRDLDAAEDEFASRDQRVNIVTNANVNHVQTVRILWALTKNFRRRTPLSTEAKTRVSFGRELILFAR
jgi:hypothetical protein